MNIEEIDDNSSQEAHPPPAASSLPTKKRSRTKKDAPAAAPSSTLTRFLGPAGPPCLSAWEDVNRQCPVCQQTGFSSRSLALHVNNCIDGGQKARDGAGDGASGAGTADGGDTPGASSTRGVRKAGRSESKASGKGSREGGARKVPRETPSKTTEVDCEGEKHAGKGKAVKKAKTQHGRGAVAARPAAATAAADKAGSSPASSRARLPNSTLHQQQQQQQQQPTPLRRRALGLARPRGAQASVDNTSTSAAATAALNTAAKSSDEGARNDIARAQLVYVLEASAGSTAQDEGWIGTRLFPKPREGEDAVDDVCVCSGSDQDVCRASCGAEACWAGRGGKTVKGGRNGRVRARPASWRAHPRDEQRGIWPGSWDASTNVDDCWGDGDGYLTLRPFPPPEPQGRSGAGAEDETRGDHSAAVAGQGGAESSRSRTQLDSAPSSRAERFLEVFSRLQPARTALNLPESPPPSPTFSPRPTEIRKPAVGHEDDGAGPRLPPNIVVGGGGGGSVSSVGQKRQPQAAADVSTAVRPVAERCAEGSIAPPLPKRTALETIAPCSARNNQRQATKTAPSSAAQTSSPVVARSRGSSPERTVTPTRTQVSAEYRQGPKQPVPAQRSVVVLEEQDPRRGAKETLGRSVPVGARKPVPSAQAQAKVGVRDHSRAQDMASEALARNGDTPGITKAPATHDVPSSEDSAGAKDSTSPQPVRVSGATVPPTLRPAASMDKEDVPIGKRGNPDMMSVDRAHEGSVTARAAPNPPLGRGSSGSSDRMIGRLPGATVTVKRGSTSRESGDNPSTAGKDDGNSDNDNRRSRGERRPGMKLAARVGSQWGCRRTVGALSSRASSGLLRNADSEAEGENQGEKGRGESEEGRGETVALSTKDASIDIAFSDPPQQQTPQGQEGKVAGVPQKGSLTVDWEHGATLRSSWSIDDSQVLGKLACGASLDYDAVWYLSPADADCVGVLRYRMVPHPTLAPTGGWISGTGRLRDDPYTIVTATPEGACVDQDVRVVSPPSAASSSKRHAGASSSRRTVATPTQRRGREATPHQQSGARDKYRHKQARAAGKAAAAPLPRGHETAQSQGIPDRRRPPAGERVEVGGKSHGFRSSAGSPPGSSLPTHIRSAATLSPRPAPVRGSFGLPTSPSAKEMESCDTGDKVTCPVCQRGMDHWKTGQRQQHVHNCLLKQPSSTKKTQGAEDSKTPTPARAPNNASRSAGRGSSKVGGGRSDQPTTPRRSGADGIRSQGLSSGRDDVLPSGPAESPRSTRVSLQGVFSPKLARGVDGSRREPGQNLGETFLSSSSSAFSPAFGRGTPTPVSNSGTGIRGISSSKGSTRAGVTNKRKAASGPAECPLCGLSFDGRQGQWEREAHIQQCLESSEGMFDSEE